MPAQPTCLQLLALLPVGTQGAAILLRHMQTGSSPGRLHTRLLLTGVEARGLDADAREDGGQGGVLGAARSRKRLGGIAAAAGTVRAKRDNSRHAAGQGQGQSPRVHILLACSLAFPRMRLGAAATSPLGRQVGGLQGCEGVRDLPVGGRLCGGERVDAAEHIPLVLTRPQHLLAGGNAAASLAQHQACTGQAAPRGRVEQ